jgi:hypothetical protein
MTRWAKEPLPITKGWASALGVLGVGILFVAPYAYFQQQAATVEQAAYGICVLRVDGREDVRQAFVNIVEQLGAKQETVVQVKAILDDSLPALDLVATCGTPPG